MTRSVLETCAAAILLIIAAGTPAPGFAGDPDPHRLLEAARLHLENGNLDSAERSATRLADLIRRNPEWDPGSVYADDLLPEILDAVVRIRGTQAKIAALTEARLAETMPPEADRQTDLMAFYADWATREIGRFYKEWDQIIGEQLHSQEERASLVRTHGYLQTVQSLEASMLLKVADAGRKELHRINEEIQKISKENLRIIEENDRLLVEIQRTDTIRSRLESVKRSTLDLALESDSFQDQLDGCREQMDNQLMVIAELIREESDLPAEPLPEGDDPIDQVFSGILEDRIDSVRAMPSGTESEHRVTREKLQRYRHFNQVLTKGNLATDHVATIALIETSLNWKPVIPPTRPRVPLLAETPKAAETYHRDLYYKSALGVLLLTTILFGWLAIRRGS